MSTDYESIAERLRFAIRAAEGFGLSWAHVRVDDLERLLAKQTEYKSIAERIDEIKAESDAKHEAAMRELEDIRRNRLALRDTECQSVPHAVRADLRDRLAAVSKMCERIMECSPEGSEAMGIADEAIVALREAIDVACLAGRPLTGNAEINGLPAMEYQSVAQYVTCEAQTAALRHLRSLLFTSRQNNTEDASFAYRDAIEIVERMATAPVTEHRSKDRFADRLAHESEKMAAAFLEEHTDCEPVVRADGYWWARVRAGSWEGWEAVLVEQVYAAEHNDGVEVTAYHCAEHGTIEADEIVEWGPYIGKAPATECRSVSRATARRALDAAIRVLTDDSLYDWIEERQEEAISALLTATDCGSVDVEENRK